MSTDHRHVRDHLDRVLDGRDAGELRERLAPKVDGEAAPRLAGATRQDAESIAKRWAALGADDVQRDALLDAAAARDAEAYQGNIEHYIGTVKLPVGVAGPLRVNGLYAQGDYYVPLATTEAALVASYARGAQVVSAAGGCSAMLLNEGLTRAPGFVFESIADVGQFVVWATQQIETFKSVAGSTTQHGELIDVRYSAEGNHVYVVFEFRTGDAAGQNMVTLATDAVCQYIAEHTPVKPTRMFVEANMSGDKKASMQSFLLVRGRKVTAEVTVSADLLRRKLRVSADDMVAYWRMSAVGGVLSGTIGVQGHYANGLAALYIASGQDAACVAESAVGVTRFEKVENDALYAAVTLPNLVVGTVGGGTSLPSQRACLDVLGLAGAGHANAFAELCAGLALAGELSIIAALAAGEFARAHRKLARGDSASAGRENGDEPPRSPSAPRSE